MTDIFDTKRGALVLMGAGEWSTESSFDADRLAIAGNEVAVVPTGAAYEQPDREIERATAWLASLGATARPVKVLSRSDAENSSLAEIVRDAQIIYLSGGSTLHMRAVLKESTLLHAMTEAWHNGATVIGSCGGATVLSDPMVDPRGGALTVGLGLVRDLAVTLHEGDDVSAQLKRTLSLAPEGCPVVALGNKAAIIRDPDGTWRTAGSGQASVYLDGKEAGLEMLAGKPVG